MAFQRAMPVLQVADVAASAAFYEKLGFQAHGFWGEPPAFSIVQRGDITLALDRAGGGRAVTPNQSWAAYLYVDNVDDLYQEYVALQIDVISKPADQEYGCREFTIADPDGHRLAFGQDLSVDEDGPGLGHERGRG